MMNIYHQAVLSQGATNLGALVRGWAKVMEEIQAEAREHNHGTDWINKHPINVLFAEQVHHLTGSSSLYSESWDACQREVEKLPKRGDPT